MYSFILSFIKGKKKKKKIAINLPSGPYSFYENVFQNQNDTNSEEKEKKKKKIRI